MVDRRELRDSPERRGIASGQFELRAAGGQLTLTGYAAVFNRSYDVMGGAPIGWTETVDPRAFDATLSAKPDLHLLINHAGMPLARTKSGTLQLATDSQGLHVEAQLDPSDPDVQRLTPKMDRGDMDEMSFAFRVKQDEWNDDYTDRRLMEVSLHKGDVSVVNFGANPATSVQLNSASDALELLAALDPDAAMAELRSEGAPDLDRIVRARDNVIALHRAAAGPRKRPRLSVAEARAMEDDIQELRLSAAIPAHSTAVSEGSMDRRAAIEAAPSEQVVLRYMHAWVDPDGDPDDKASYRFAHHEGRIGSPANLAAVRYALSRLPQSDIPEEQRAAVERHLRKHLTDAD
jgi:HK97 family phage prohead protease